MANQKTKTIEYSRYRQLARNEERLLKITAYVGLIKKILDQYNKGNKTRK